MADVDRRRTRDPAPGKGDYARRAIQSSALPRRASGGRGGSPLKPEKHEPELATAAAAHRSCGALLELLVCATASYETHYCPCETPVQNEAAMRFWEAG